MDEEDERAMLDTAIRMGVDPIRAAEIQGVDNAASLTAKGMRLPAAQRPMRAYTLLGSEKEWERQAGRDLVKQGGVVMPADLAAGSATRLLWQLQTAIERGMARSQTTVQVGADTVAKAHTNAPAHRTRPAH
jgi:hypothetical protein